MEPLIHAINKTTTHLDLLQREAAALAQLGVVPDGRATHHRADRAGGGAREQRAGLLDALLTATLLAGRLVEPGADVAPPVLVEMPVRDHVVSLSHLEGVCVLRTPDEGRRNPTHADETEGNREYKTEVRSICLHASPSEHPSSRRPAEPRRAAPPASRANFGRPAGGRGGGCPGAGWPAEKRTDDGYFVRFSKRRTHLFARHKKKERAV